MPSVREIHRQIRVAQLPKAITNADSPYTVVASDYCILADASGGNITINLPAVGVSDGRDITVKKTDSSANTVTVSA